MLLRLPSNVNGIRRGMVLVRVIGDLTRDNVHKVDELVQEGLFRVKLGYFSRQQIPKIL
jgi:hypothetical protein